MGVLEVVLAANDKRNLYFWSGLGFSPSVELEQGDRQRLHLIPAGGAAPSPPLLSLLICLKA